MGKAEDGQILPSTAVDAQGTTPNARNSNGCCLGCSRLKKMVSFRCVFALVLGVAVLLSSVFWLPLFHFGDKKDLDLDYAGHDIVASFMLKKPASFLNDYILQLEDDIFDEMSFASTKVQIISLESSAESNITKVVFAVEADAATMQSLIRASFVYFFTNQSSLHLTESLFGDPFAFDVLKFRGGITASPDQQKAFLLQNVQILFNFTLNFSIDQIIDNFDELTSQLKTGLHLAPYENLYIRLTNLKGSTVSPPTTVQSKVVLAVGANPTKSRFKQLAQTIGSNSKNLGLNHTVFGRVKQVSLSSILQHSLGTDGNPSPSPSPSPSLPHSPPPSLSHHHHHRHHHHHHHVSIPPTVPPSPSRVRGRRGSPVPTPAPGKKKKEGEPPGCNFGHNNWKQHKHSHIAPSPTPVYAPRAAAPSPKSVDHPKVSPVPSESPVPNAAHARSQPPSQGEYHARPSNMLPLVSPGPSPSSAGTSSFNIRALLLFILLGLLL